MMDPHYQAMYKQAATMQHTFHDYTHANAYDPNAMVLSKQIHSLTTDLATGKNPRFIENRLRTIQNQVQRAQIMNPTVPHGQSPLFSMSQRNNLHGGFENMRRNIMQHPHF